MCLVLGCIFFFFWIRKREETFGRRDDQKKKEEEISELIQIDKEIELNMLDEMHKKWK